MKPAVLSKSQIDVQQMIVDYGRENNFNTKDIEYAVKAAYVESSLGANEHGQGTISGLYQYSNGTWHDLHPTLDKQNDRDQVEAFYKDMSKFSEQYSAPGDGQAARDAGLTREEFMYAKHHDGRFSHPNMESPGTEIWNQVRFQPEVPPRETPSHQADYGGYGM